MSVRRRPRLALIGCGWIAGNRLRQIADDDLVDLVALVDSSVQACEATRARAPAAKMAQRLDALDTAGIDAAMISTPSGLHAEQALALLERHVPVFVQKPLAISARDTAQVLDTAAARDLPVDTDFCYRHLHTVAALRDELALGTVGRPYYISICFHNAYRPGAQWSNQLGLAGGGVLIDLGIHLVDLVCWLTGQRAALREADLRCRGRPLRHGQVEDFARLELALEHGAAVHATCAWDASVGRDARIGIEIHGDGGTLALANRDGSFFHFDAYRYTGTTATHLAADDTDRWQAGPLIRWLHRVRAGAGYGEPAGLRHTAALIDAAYTAGRAAAPHRAPPRPASWSRIPPTPREHFR